MAPTEEGGETNDKNTQNPDWNSGKHNEKPKVSGIDKGFQYHKLCFICYYKRVPTNGHQGYK